MLCLERLRIGAVGQIGQIARYVRVARARDGAVGDGGRARRQVDVRSRALQRARQEIGGGGRRSHGAAPDQKRRARLVQAFARALVVGLDHLHLFEQHVNAELAARRGRVGQRSIRRASRVRASPEDSCLAAVASSTPRAEAARFVVVLVVALVLAELFVAVLVVLGSIVLVL